MINCPRIQGATQSIPRTVVQYENRATSRQICKFSEPAIDPS